MRAETGGGWLRAGGRALRAVLRRPCPVFPALLAILLGSLPAGALDGHDGAGRLSVFLGRQADSFVDPTGRLTAEDIRARPDAFLPPDGRVANRGSAPTATTAFWLRIPFPPLGPGPYMLSLDEPRVRRARLYDAAGGPDPLFDWYPERDFAEGRRNLRLPTFEIEGATFGGRTALLRVETPSSMRASLWLQSAGEYQHGNDQRNFAFGVITGILTGLLIYLLAAGALLPDRTLLRLGVLALFFCISIVADRGFIETLLIPGAFTTARSTSLSFSFFTLAAWLWFCTHFLQTATSWPAAARPTKVVCALLVACGLWAGLEPILGIRVLRGFVAPIGLSAMLLSVALAFLAPHRDRRRSLAFLLCWLPAVAGSTLRMSLDAFPSLSASPLAVNAIYAGVTFSLLVFGLVSFADLQARERRLREAAEESEERFRTFARIASDSVWETDGAGAVRFTSGFTASAVGLKTGRSLIEGMRSGPDRWSPEDLDRLDAALAGRSTFRSLVVAGRSAADEPRFLAFSGAVVRYGDGDGRRGVLTDVTAERLRQDRLAQQDKLAALGQLAGGIAHEINNLLHPILNLTRRVRDGLVPDTPGRYQLGIVADAAHRAGEIVRGVLDTARPTPSGAQLPLREAVERSLCVLRPILPQFVSLTLRPGTHPGPLIGSGEIMQVLANLVANAAHAIPGRGTIAVAIEPAKDGGTVLRVSDNGVGMSPEVLAQATQPFFTTRPTSGGTGLGLSVVGNIVVGWGGTLDLRSEIGHGTTVEITLPGAAGRERGEP